MFIVYWSLFWEKAPRDVFFYFHFIVTFGIIKHFLELFAKFKDPYCVDIWLPWIIFTYVVAGAWLVAIVALYMGLINCFEPKSICYKRFAFGSLGFFFLLSIIYGYLMMLQPDNLGLAMVRNITPHADHIEDEFGNPEYVNKWIFERTYYAGRGTIIMSLMWSILTFSLIYPLTHGN